MAALFRWNARFCIPAITASIWFGLPSSFSCAALSASRASGAGISALSEISRLAARTASGERAAISPASASDRVSGSSAISVTKPQPSAASAPKTSAV